MQNCTNILFSNIFKIFMESFVAQKRSTSVYYCIRAKTSELAEKLLQKCSVRKKVDWLNTKGDNTQQKKFQGSSLKAYF